MNSLQWSCMNSLPWHPSTECIGTNPSKQGWLKPENQNIDSVTPSCLSFTLHWHHFKNISSNIIFRQNKNGIKYQLREQQWVTNIERKHWTKATGTATQTKVNSSNLMKHKVTKNKKIVKMGNVTSLCASNNNYKVNTRILHLFTPTLT